MRWVRIGWDGVGWEVRFASKFEKVNPNGQQTGEGRRWRGRWTKREGDNKRGGGGTRYLGEVWSRSIQESHFAITWATP